MGQTVKTYRALKTQNVAGKVRHFGDFVPEASEWPNLAVWLRAGHIEETFMDSDQLEEAITLQRVHDGVEEPVASDSLPGADEDEEGTDEEPNEPANEGPKKVLKVKKGKNNG